MNRILMAALVTVPAVAAAVILDQSGIGTSAPVPAYSPAQVVTQANPELPHCGVEPDIRMVEPRLFSKPCSAPHNR
jgi:hypothetical protein